MTKEKPPLVYAVPDFNITNIVITLCLQKVVLVAGARCFMSFTYGFYGHSKHIPLMSSRLLSRALRNWSFWVNHLIFHKQNLASSSAPPVTALTELLSIPVCVMGKYVLKYQLLTVRAISDQGICNSAKQ